MQNATRQARLRIAAAICAASLLTACTDLDARFVPDCIAFEGETMTLSSGRFEWQRFTDMIRIGPDGEPVDPFPGFPKHGAVRRDGARLALTADDGERLPDRYIVETDGRLYLLTAAEHDAWQGSATLPDCPLVAEDRQN